MSNMPDEIWVGHCVDEHKAAYDETITIKKHFAYDCKENLSPTHHVKYFREAELSPIMQMLEKRIAWLEKERRSGGDHNHLTTRLEECKYIYQQISRGIK